MSDGVRLERYAGNPILAPIPGSDWESRTVFNCGVTQLDDAVVLVYRAQGMDNNISRLGFAVSTDGYQFARLDRPIFEPGARDRNVGRGRPATDDDRRRYHMLYTAWSPLGIQVAMASSSNLFTWERHGIVLPGPDNKDAAIFPDKVGGRYVMFHRIPPSIWLAYSDDLVHWGDYQADPRSAPGTLGRAGNSARADRRSRPTGAGW